MMSREEILSIEQYCSAHNVTHKQRLAELNIPFWKFYRAKQRYRNQDEAGKDGGFVQLVPGGPFQPAAMPAPRTSGRSRSGNSIKVEACESYLSVEMRTSSGTAMRIMGNMTPGHLREIIQAVGNNA